MENESVTISLRIPKNLNDDLEKYVKLGRYASKTELLREAIRATLYESISLMRGALKTKGKKRPPLSAWRASQWQAALKKFSGDSAKAVSFLKKKEREAISGLKF